MRWERLVGSGARIAVLGALVAACANGGTSDDSLSTSTSPSTTDPFAACIGPIDRMGDATERYIAGYEAAVVASAPTQSTSPTGASDEPDGVEELSGQVIDEAGYQDALGAAQERLAALRCDPLRTRLELRRRLVALEATSPVADAVLRQLTATLTDPAATTPVDVTVGVGDDLRQAVATAADGSVIRLAPGVHRLDGPLVVLSGLRIVGAGADQSTIVSDAADAVVVTLTDQTVRFEQLALRHDGDRPASVLLGGPASSTAIDDVLITGARVDADGLGGSGILLFAGDRADEGRGTTLELTDVDLVDNEAAGVVLSGAHRVSAVRIRVVGSGQCALCFFDSADGSVEDSVLEANAVGIAATGSARPALLRVEVAGGEVGLQAAGSSAPVLRRVVLAGQTQAAAIFTDLAGGSLEGVNCVDVEFGLVVGPDARPLIGETDCEVVRAPG